MDERARRGSDPGEDEEARAAAILAVLDALDGARCRGCGAALCGHEAVFSIVLGFKDAPRCLPCLARGLDREPRELRDHALDHILHRPCFAQGWERASAREGLAGPRPSCLFGEGPMRAGSSPENAGGGAAMSEPDERWDAGDMACGELVLELRLRLRALSPGKVIEVRATDAGAIEDIPAWCRLTGHALASAEHPIYRIVARAREP